MIILALSFSPIYLCHDAYHACGYTNTQFVTHATVNLFSSLEGVVEEYGKLFLLVLFRVHCCVYLLLLLNSIHVNIAVSKIFNLLIHFFLSFQTDGSLKKTRR